MVHKIWGDIAAGDAHSAMWNSGQQALLVAGLVLARQKREIEDSDIYGQG